MPHCLKLYQFPHHYDHNLRKIRTHHHHHHHNFLSPSIVFIAQQAWRRQACRYSHYHICAHAEDHGTSKHGLTWWPPPKHVRSRPTSQSQKVKKNKVADTLTARCHGWRPLAARAAGDGVLLVACARLRRRWLRRRWLRLWLRLWLVPLHRPQLVYPRAKEILPRRQRFLPR